MREKGDQYLDFNFLCCFWWVTSQYPHLKNVSRCTPGVHGSTQLTTTWCWCSGALLGKWDGGQYPFSSHCPYLAGYSPKVEMTITRSPERAKPDIFPFSFPAWLPTASDLPLPENKHTKSVLEIVWALQGRYTESNGLGGVWVVLFQALFIPATNICGVTVPSLSAYSIVYRTLCSSVFQ